MVARADVQRHPLGSGIYLEIEGEVSLATFLTLRDLLNRCLEDTPTRVALCLDGVSYFDTTGLGLLIGLHRRMLENRGKLVVVCTHPHHLQVLRLTQVDRFLDIVDTVDAAAIRLGISEDGRPLPEQPRPAAL